LTIPPDDGPTGTPSEPPSDHAVGQPPGPAPDVASPPAPLPAHRLRSFLIGLVLAAVLAVILFVGLGTTSRPSGPEAGGVVPVGSVAPDFTLPSVAGAAPVHLYQMGRARHHPVVLNFFASWCVPCQQETPLLATTSAAEQAKGSVLQFVGVDVAEQTSVALPFITKSGITYPVGQDPDARVAAGLYGLSGEPQTFFLDESGVVVGHHLGALDKAQLASWVHRLTGGH
jgi:cytochrome c biogenesis protein CcmG/thiol:disulfide interchange protein DsbE